MNIKLKSVQQVSSSFIFSVILMFTAQAGAEMTDAERAADLQQQKEQMQLQQNEVVDQDYKPEKNGYKLPQLRNESSGIAKLGHRDLYSTDLKSKAKAKAEKKGQSKYSYSGQGRQKTKSSTSLARPLNYKKSGGVVGNTKLQTTRISKAKVGSKLGGRLAR